jgi:hypothetical protein
MTIRAKALRWLARRGRIANSHIVTSKLYAPEKSWTVARAWWIQIPKTAIRAGKTIEILCEASPGADLFRHLRVPAHFFQDQLDAFATIGDDKINLYLSAEPESELQDLRGPGSVPFAQFEIRR